MKKLSKILALALVLVMLTAAFVVTTNAAAGETWTVAGSSALCGSNWNPGDANNRMSYDAATDTYYKVYNNVAAGTYELKCVKGTSWGTEYPGSNYVVTVSAAQAGYTLTIKIKGTTVSHTLEAPTCDHDFSGGNVCAGSVKCSKCDVYSGAPSAHNYGSDSVCDNCGFDHAVTHTVYFKNTANWANVYVHNWSDAGGGTSWPGTKVTVTNGVASITVPAGRDKIIFHNNSGTQTSDLLIPGDNVIYDYSTGTWSDYHVHNYVAGEVVAPTYTAGGYTVYSCSCGLTENRDETPALEVTFPEAVVTPIENPELTFALNFGIKDLEAIMANEALVEALFAKYGKMYVDYRLTIEGLTVDSVVFNADGTADGYLGGQYDEWSSDWVYVPFENVTIENGGSIMIMELAAKLMGKDGLRMTLEEIVAIVADFDCGVYFTPEFLAANPGMKVTLELIVFNEENGELVDVINVAKNEFTAPELPHVNTLVVGETNKIVVSGETLNDWGLPIEWVPFVATEDGFYSFVGDNGALAYIFTAEGGLVSATGAANLEAGTYLICLGNGLAGEFNVAVTKAAWVNALTVGENKILITDALDNGYGYYIVWVPFEVTEKANYTFGGEGLAVLVFDAAYGSVATTELEVGTYNICIAFGTPATTGVATVTVEKTAIGGGEVVEPEEPTLGLGDNTVVIDGSQVNLTGNAIAWYTFTPETSGTYTFACEDLTVYILNAKNMADLNAYVGNGGVAELEAGVTYYVLVGKEGIKGEFTVNVSVGGVVAEKNTMVVGNNHYVITDALLSVGYEFITIEITEPGTYVVAGGAPMKVYMWTIVNGMDDRNFVWNVDAMEESGFAPYFEITLQEAGTYYLGFNYEFVTDEREFDISITFKAPLPTEPSDPTPVDPVEPEQEEEELGFWANLWAKILAFLNSIVEFFKNLF